MLSIIGCGNPNRQDDGAGIYVIQMLKPYLETHQYKQIKIFDAGTSGMDVMFQARGSDALIIIDANLSNSEAGTIFKVPGDVLETLPEPAYNLHDFRWNHALYAGRRIYQDDFPEDIDVYLIEAESVALGIGLSEKVQQAADRVVEMIIAHIICYINPQ